MEVFTNVYRLLSVGVDKFNDKILKKKFKHTAFILSRSESLENSYKNEEQFIFRDKMKDAKSLRGTMLELMRKFLKKQ